MKTYQIALLPGDGIGPEVLRPTLAVMQSAAEQVGIELAAEHYSAGAEHYRQHGVALPEDVLAACRAADAVLLTAIGLPDVRQADGTEIQPVMMVGLRRALELHSAIRPIKLYPGVPCPLRDIGAGIDFVILRENLEGLFASFGAGTRVGDQVATDTLVVTRDGTARACHSAFQLALHRRGRPLDGRRMVTCVDKANVFRSLAFFREVFTQVASEYPEIDTEATYVDAAALYLVQQPQAFDVIVTENQFGDILSDLGAALVGGLGLAPSAEIGPHHGLFQPSHGSAPPLAGRDLANPLATILSAAMMLRWLGQKHQDERVSDAGERIETAVARVLAEGRVVTRDLGGSAGTQAVGMAVLEMLSGAA